MGKEHYRKLTNDRERNYDKCFSILELGKLTEARQKFTTQIQKVRIIPSEAIHLHGQTVLFLLKNGIFKFCTDI
jgi:hypothetical protein